MKSFFRYFVLSCVLLIVLSACQGTTNVQSQTEASTVTTDGKSEIWSEYPSDWPELSPEAMKNRDAILELLPEPAFAIRNVAYYSAHGIAELIEMAGISELSAIELIESDWPNYYLVRFVDSDNNAFRTYVNKRSGGADAIWKEGEERPIYQRWW